MSDALELEAFLPYRLNRLAAEVSRELQGAYKAEFGLTVPEWRVIATLGQFGAATAKAIGAHSAMHKTKVSRAVAALEARRWVERAANPSDRREAFVTLTRQGRRAYRRLVTIARGYEAHLYEGLSPPERSAIERALGALERRFLGTGRPLSAPRADAAD